MIKEGRGKREEGRQGQMIIEYAVMFMVIVAAVIFAATTFFRPSLNSFFCSASSVINKAAENIAGTF